MKVVGGWGRGAGAGAGWSGREGEGESSGTYGGDVQRRGWECRTSQWSEG